MRRYQSLFAGVVLAVAVAYEIVAWQMPRGRVGYPGPGFFPMIVGAFFVLTASACLVQALTTRRASGAEEPASPSRLPAKIWLLVSILIFYAIIVQPLGFPIALMLFLLAAIRIFGYRKWLPAAGIAAALTLISYLTFVVWLKVPLPLGILSDLLD